MDAIKQASAEYLGEELEAAKTFKVEAKRSDKNSHSTLHRFVPRWGILIGGHILI